LALWPGYKPSPACAWPAPFEQVHLLPSAGRRQTLTVDDLSRAEPPAPDQAPSDRRGFLLTADGALIGVTAEVGYRITDPARWLLHGADPEMLLRRSTCQALIHTCSMRSAEDLLIRDLGGAKRAVAATLDTNIGAHLGIQVERVELTVLLPGSAKPHFDRAQSALAVASRQVSEARRQAEQKMISTRNSSARLAEAGRAEASEAVAAARAAVGPIAAAIAAGGDRNDAFDRRLSALLNGLRTVTVPAGDGIRLQMGASR
jgi:regulator of protease activity HflC (stomatin/prohibitin superfamily)